jgi:hypothetical protein
MRPDPLFLQHPNLYLKDTASCKLNAFSRNNPLSYVDLRGEKSIMVPALAIPVVFVRGSAKYEGIIA